MSSHTPRATRSEPRPAAPSPSLTTLVAFPLVLVALLVAVSYPLAAAAVLIAATLAAKAGQFALATLVERTNGAPHRLRVPGVGTVTVSVTPA